MKIIIIHPQKTARRRTRPDRVTDPTAGLAGPFAPSNIMPRQHQQRQLLAPASLFLLLVLLVASPLAGAFLLLPSSPTPRLPVSLSKQLKPLSLPSTPLPPATWDAAACRRRRKGRPAARFVEEGDGSQTKQAQQLNPLDELERQLKGQEPPTVYVQQTPQGKMRIPLPPVRVVGLQG